MPQIIQCPSCAKKLSAPDQLAGKQVACPVCKSAVSIPALKTAAPAQRAPSQPAAAPTKVAANAQRSASRPAPSRPVAPQPAAKKPALPPNATAIQCPHCAKSFTGPVQLHGKTVPCPVCNKQFTVLVPGQPVPSAKSPTAHAPVSSLASATPQKGVAAAKSAAPVPARRFALADRRPRMLYLVFALAFIPLALQTLSSDSDLEDRFGRTLAAHPGLKEKLDEVSEKEFFDLIPDHRIEGALLSHDAHDHWVYALVSAAIFFGVCWGLFDPGKTTITQWLIVLVFTATIGIISLLAFQWMAAITGGLWVTGRSVLVILFYIVKFIGYSYSAASDPDTGFLLSFLGFTFGVGLCEEVTKALPVIVWLGEDKKLDWRSAVVLGLASGIGFGVVEGIIYSGDHYNGLTTADIYFTRFISCVALHATWTAAVALMAVRHLGGFNTSEATDYAVHMLLIISVPAILHGLYDTLLKKGFDGYALAVALASFAWLAILIERARSSDEEPAPRRFASAAA